MSPTLFNIYIEDLIIDLNDIASDTKGILKANALGFADDIVTMNNLK